jgi:predicted acyltransferase
MNNRKLQRISSIDVLRGLVLVAVILVNNPGSWDHVYSLLLESTWQGFAFPDTIFPTFIFVMGLAIPFALANFINNHNYAYSKILKRTILLFVLGILYHILANILVLSHLRVLGVLQRIALVYLLCYLSFIWFRQIKAYIILGILGLIIYWSLILFITPGFTLNLSDPSSNLGAFVDRFIFGHYIYSTAGVYHGYDPESLLGTLSAYYNGILGVIIGVLLSRYATNSLKFVGYSATIAILSLLFGIIIANYIPIIKILWTPSFALISGGVSVLEFIIIYIIFDYYKICGVTNKFINNFVVPLSKYSIIVYGLEEVLIGTLFGIVPIIHGQYLDYALLFAPLTKYVSPNLASLISAFVCVIVVIIIVKILQYTILKNRENIST